MGTGLELDRIDDYEVDVLLHNTKNLDFDFNEHSIETYVINNLFERALDQNKKYSDNRLILQNHFQVWRTDQISKQRSYIGTVNQIIILIIK